MKRWYDNWDAITPIFKFSPDVRKVIYTTNAIESLNLPTVSSTVSVFPSDTALLKALYLATFEATKKWTMSIRNWGRVYGELSIMYEDILNNEFLCIKHEEDVFTSALDMPEIMSYIYNKSWKLQFSASSSIIIIEDFYLQTFLHSLCFH